jgi:hypothetical protein
MQGAWITTAIETLARAKGVSGIQYFSFFNNIAHTCRDARNKVEEVTYRQAAALLQHLYPEPNFECGYVADLTKLKPHIRTSHYTELYDLLSNVPRHQENFFGWPVLRIAYLLHTSPIGAIMGRDFSEELLNSLFPLFEPKNVQDRDRSEASAYIDAFFEETSIMKYVTGGWEALDWVVRTEGFAVRYNENARWEFERARDELERASESKRRRVAD